MEQSPIFREVLLFIQISISSLFCQHSLIMLDISVFSHLVDEVFKVNTYFNDAEVMIILQSDY